MEDVEARWDACRRSNPRYFDAPAYHVLGVHRNGAGGAVVHAVVSSYRFHAVQEEGFDVGFRGIGVRGLTRHDGHVMVARRSHDVARYPGLWEHAPAGKLDVGSEPAQMITDELIEETGLTPAAPPTVMAMIYDPLALTWEIIFNLHVTSNAVRLSDEYLAYRWLPMDASRESDVPPGDWTPIDRTIRTMYCDSAATQA